MATSILTQRRLSSVLMASSAVLTGPKPCSGVSVREHVCAPVCPVRLCLCVSSQSPLSCSAVATAAQTEATRWQVPGMEPFISGTWTLGNWRVACGDRTGEHGHRPPTYPSFRATAAPAPVLSSQFQVPMCLGPGVPSPRFRISHPSEPSPVHRVPFHMPLGPSSSCPVSPLYR